MNQEVYHYQGIAKGWMWKKKMIDGSIAKVSFERIYPQESYFAEDLVESLKQEDKGGSV